MEIDPQEQDDQDEAEWDAQFAATPISAFKALIQAVLVDYHNGQTDEFDPNIEDD